jgi:hypothetical protein
MPQGCINIMYPSTGQGEVRYKWTVTVQSSKAEYNLERYEI